METAVQVLEKMEGALDELIRNAEKLKDISLGEFSEQAVTPLQQKQEILVQQLKGLETAFESAEKEGHEKMLAKIGDRIAKKLRYFQHLNAVFIENVGQGNFMEDFWKSEATINDIGLPKRRKEK